MNEQNPVKNTQKMSDRALLQKIAHDAMEERQLLTEFSPEALAQLATIQAPAQPDGDPDIHDLRHLIWTSIDNDDSRDLDQITVAELLENGDVRIRVAIADVDALVPLDCAIDEHALNNTTSVYTAAQIFPMLPEKLSTDLTSLNMDVDRLAMVMEMVVGEDGLLRDEKIYRAYVHNYAQLAYNSVAAWMDGKGEMPERIGKVPGLAENLILQDRVAQSLRKVRDELGALDLETIQTKPVFEGDEVVALAVEERNRAKELIEDFMIAANGVTARFLAKHQYPSIRRVVRTPDRWDKIVEFAAQYQYKLPRRPDSKKLNAFLLNRKRKDALRFPDVSLTIIKLLGSGEYVAEKQGREAPGHFGLAIKDYAHSTAPNRRYPDLITQRLLKACLKGQPSPYAFDELEGLAYHLTDQEDIVTKVERQVGKSAAALLLEDHIGDVFNGIITGASDKGTWVRILEIPVEGKLIRGARGLDVSDRVMAQLVDVNVEKGFIDFERVKAKPR